MNYYKKIFRKTFLLPLIFGALITGILVIFATSRIFIKPLFSSEALIYVPLTIPSKQIEQQGIGFASDIEIDGHIQMLQSSRVRDSLISRFSLYKTYNIDAKELGSTNKLYNKLNERIKISKTRYSSVSIEVKDRDPLIAAEMANSLVELGDIIKEEILFTNRKEAFLQSQKHFEDKQNSVKELESSIDSLEINIVNREASRLENNELFKLKNLYAIELEEMASRKNHLESVKLDFETELPKSYIISDAIPVTEPVWPKRKLLILLSMFTYGLLFLIFHIVKWDVQNK